MEEVLKNFVEKYDLKVEKTMKTYTVEQLKDMNVTEVKAIAKNERKLKLSSNGKRFTKPELISMILESQPKKKSRKTTQKPTIITIDTSKIDSIVIQCKKLLSENVGKNKDIAIQKVIGVIQELQLQNKKEKVNMFQNRKRNKYINNLKLLLAQYGKKIK